MKEGGGTGTEEHLPGFSGRLVDVLEVKATQDIKVKKKSSSYLINFIIKRGGLRYERDRKP